MVIGKVPFESKGGSGSRTPRTSRRDSTTSIIGKIVDAGHRPPKPLSVVDRSDRDRRRGLLRVFRAAAFRLINFSAKFAAGTLRRDRDNFGSLQLFRDSCAVFFVQPLEKLLRNREHSAGSDGFDCYRRDEVKFFAL